MDKISIIVPVYKVEAYLRECVDSIINQTYKNLEIILVDDGSPDNCPAICDEYALKDERIIVIHQKNGGLSAARNAGLEIATGEYICFVDSDDLIHPQYCEILYNGIHNTDSSFCACRSTTFKNTATNLKLDRVTDVTYSSEIWYDYIKHTQMGVWNKIYKSDLFENIRFYNGKIHEDIIFCADIASVVSETIRTTDSVLYFGRLRDSSICSSSYLKPDRIFAAEYFIEKSTIDTNLFKYALWHSLSQPWHYVDLIYIRFAFKENLQFLKALQKLIKKYLIQYLELPQINEIQKSRMKLFSKSLVLYAFNAYGRLLRVYLYRIFKKDPYKDGHGI